MLLVAEKQTTDGRNLAAYVRPLVRSSKKTVIFVAEINSVLGPKNNPGRGVKVQHD